jgi:hypothetical protein
LPAVGKIGVGNTAVAWTACSMQCSCPRHLNGTTVSKTVVNHWKISCTYGQPSSYNKDNVRWVQKIVPSDCHQIVEMIADRV